MIYKDSIEKMWQSYPHIIHFKLTRPLSDQFGKNVSKIQRLPLDCWWNTTHSSTSSLQLLFVSVLIFFLHVMVKLHRQKMP